MSEQTAITVLGGSTFIGPAASLAQFRERYQVFNSFVKENLRDKVDFQTIPGTDKPSLVKPGAEKLCALFGLSTRFTVASIVEDWTGADHGGEPFFYYRYRCILYRGDLLVSECEGSCNSWEKKYRYRQADLKCPKCGKTTIIAGKKEYGGGWLCFGKKGGCGAKFPDTAPEIVSQPRGQIANNDIADVVNTLQKMAQKRAFVGATLIATNASEYFTQDTEDMPQFVEAEIVEVQTTQPSNGKSTPPAAPVVVVETTTTERHGETAQTTAYADHIVYTGKVAKLGGRNGHNLPAEWVRVMMMNIVSLGIAEEYAANIIWAENIPQDTDPAAVVEIVRKHLSEKAQQ